MVIVGFGLAFIVGAIFVTWLGVRRLQVSWRQKRSQRSRLKYYKDQRASRHDSE
jgi:hypothetical protein